MRRRRKLFFTSKKEIKSRYDFNDDDEVTNKRKCKREREREKERERERESKRKRERQREREKERERERGWFVSKMTFINVLFEFLLVLFSLLRDNNVYVYV